MVEPGDPCDDERDREHHGREKEREGRDAQRLLAAEVDREQRLEDERGHEDEERELIEGRDRRAEALLEDEAERGNEEDRQDDVEEDREHAG